MKPAGMVRLGAELRSRRRGEGAAVIALVSILATWPGSASGSTIPRMVLERLGTDLLLHRVVRDGRVDYVRLERETAGLQRALRLAADVTAEDLASRPAPARLAFWINAYNLATLDLVSAERRRREGRLRSVQEIPAAWSRPRWSIAGAKRTLDEIEHEVIRKEFREPRIHMALVCASVSCPSLRPDAFDAERLERQLEEASRDFVNDPARNQFVPNGGRIRISKIFDWYGGDFVGAYRDTTLERLYGAKDAAVLSFALRYLPEPAGRVLRRERVGIDYLPYDWGLNDAAGSAGTRAAPARGSKGR